MTKRKMFFLVGAPVVVALVVLVAVRRGHRTPAADKPVAASSQKQRPLFFPAVPIEGKPDEARKDTEGSKPNPNAGLLYHDSFENARLVAETDEFKAFASSANLTADEQRQVSHIVALYYMDDAALQSKAVDAEKLLSMRRQLLIHMHVRVRAKIPNAWAEFERTKLLPPVEPEPAKTKRT